LFLDIGKIHEIIAISETKLQTKFNTYLPGYSFIQNDYETNAGGVGLLIKDTLNFTVIENYKLNCSGCEKIWIKININGTEKVFSVIYRHPSN